MTIEEAVKFVKEAFGSRVDQGGDFYYNHCIRVMENLPSYVSDDVRHAALLHDVMEDLGYTATQLLDAGFSRRTVYLVKQLTHDEFRTYEQYIRELAESGDRDLIEIKLSDNIDNGDWKRLIKTSEKFQKFARERYIPARIILRNALRAWENP